MFIWTNEIRNTRRFPLTAVGLMLLPAMGLTGCEPRSPAETKLVASVFAPEDKAVVEHSADTDPSRDGLQVDVVVRGEDTGARNVQLETAELLITFENGGTATHTASSVEGDTATFSGVTLFGGPNAILARIQERNAWTAEAEIEVIGARNRPSVVSITYPQDLNADGILNLAELPSNATVPSIRVTTSGMEEGGTVQVRRADGVVLSALATLEPGGVVDIPLTSLSLPLGELELPLSVELRSASGDTNNLGLATPTDPRDEAAFPMLRVDRIPPTLELIAPGSGLYTQTRNLLVLVRAHGASGRQVSVATQTEDGAPLNLAPFTLDANGFAYGTREFPLGVNTVTATVTDAAGNPAQASTSGIRLTCSIVFTAPAGGQAVTLGSSDDDVSYNTPSHLEYTVRGIARNCGGRTVSIVDDQGGEPSEIVAGPDGSFAFGIQVPGGVTATFIASVTDPTGLSTNTSKTITVDLPAPTPAPEDPGEPEEPVNP